MLNLKYILSAFVLLFLSSCSTWIEVENYHPKRVKITVPPVDASPEQIDRLKYFTAKLGDTVTTTIKRNNKTITAVSTYSDYVEYNEYGDILLRRMSYSARLPGEIPSEIVVYDYSLNPLLGIYKHYYDNGMISHKGVISSLGFKMGKWYNYDEQGNLLSVRDNEGDFKFNYKKVFKFCNERGIPLECSTATGNRYGTMIDKVVYEGRRYWLIMYKSKNPNWYNRYELDADTGEILVSTNNDER